MQERVINPYVFGHSLNFQDNDLLWASVHQLRAYRSEEQKSDSLYFINLVVLDDVVKDVTKEMLETLIRFSACTSGRASDMVYFYLAQYKLITIRQIAFTVHGSEFVIMGFFPNEINVK